MPKISEHLYLVNCHNLLIQSRFGTLPSISKILKRICSKVLVLGSFSRILGKCRDWKYHNEQSVYPYLASVDRLGKWFFKIHFRSIISTATRISVEGCIYAWKLCVLFEKHTLQWGSTIEYIYSWKRPWGICNGRFLFYTILDNLTLEQAFSNTENISAVAIFRKLQRR